MSRLFTSGGQSIRASASVLPMNIQDWFPLGWTGWISLQSKGLGLSRVFYSTTTQKHQFFGTQPSLWSNSHIQTWLLEKTIALTIRTFVGKMISLLFNMLSRFVTAFLPRSKHHLISGNMIWYSHIFKNFPQFIVIHIVKGFNILNETKVDGFLEFSSFLYDPTNVGNLIFDFSAFSKCSLYISKFSVHILMKPSLKDFEHNFASMWNECKCMIAWTFFGIALLWDWNENWPFQYCGHCWVFQICWHMTAALQQHHLLGF